MSEKIIRTIRDVLRGGGGPGRASGFDGATLRVIISCLLHNSVAAHRTGKDGRRNFPSPHRASPATISDRIRCSTERQKILSFAA
ncbi:hypothetical protein PUN28_016045 [Cardiocondyla obscurior]|uniref:Uncharacterized protein n=1 Tax=Cardiocondyla obscurior TaxID=286306 RepID=A0AAW2EQP8_9HYME